MHLIHHEAVFCMTAGSAGGDVSNMFTHIIADMRRYYTHRPSPKEFLKFIFNPRTQGVALYRMSCWAYMHGLKRFALVLQTVNIIFWSLDLTPKMEIGKGLQIKHTLGVVLAFFRAGENLTVYSGVTVGSADGNEDFSERSRPMLGDNVTLYDGVKIFGRVKVGDNVIVAANSVVLKNIPSNCIVAGSPAKIIRYLPGYVRPADQYNYCEDAFERALPRLVGCA